MRNVLEGSVRKSGARVTLIDATTGGRLWAERFDRDMADIFAVQPRGEVRIERKRSLGRVTASSQRRAQRQATPSAHSA